MPKKITKFFKKAKKGKPYAKSKGFKKTSKKSYKKAYKKKGVNRKARKTGTHTWLSYGVGTHHKTRPFIKKLEKVLVTNIYTNNESGAIQPTTGRQQAAIVSSALTNDGLLLQVALASSNQSFKAIVKDVSVITTFMNQTNAPVFMDLYDIIAREDIRPGTTGIVHNLDPYQTWLHDPTTTTLPTYIDTTPFDAPSFVALWKVLRVTRINLAAAETCEHKTILKPNLLWNDARAYVMGSPGDPGSYGGLTSFTMAVVKGSPCDAVNTTVTSSLAKVDWVTSYRMAYEFITTSGPQITNVNTLVTTATEDVMNEAIGAPQVVVVA